MTNDKLIQVLADFSKTLAKVERQVNELGLAIRRMDKAMRGGNYQPPMRPELTERDEQEKAS